MSKHRHEYGRPTPWGANQKKKCKPKARKPKINKPTNLPDVNALIRAGASKAAIQRVVAANSAAVIAAEEADKAIHAAHALQMKELNRVNLTTDIEDLKKALADLDEVSEGTTSYGSQSARLA